MSDKESALTSSESEDTCSAPEDYKPPYNLRKTTVGPRKANKRK